MTNKDLVLLKKKYGKQSKKFDQELLKILLKETGEEFLSLPELSQKYDVKLVYIDKKNAYLRKSIALSLIQTAKYFNKRDFILQVESAYRSFDEQKRRFIERYQLMKDLFPGMSKPELLEKSNTYTAGIPVLAAHTAGAAVDVTLLDKNGSLLDFGVPYRHGDIESATDYPNLPNRAKENRGILKKGMERYDFINYPFEYWHYSIGDVCAAYLTGQKSARFGPVSFDSTKQELLLPKNTKDLYKFFDTDIK